MEVCKCVHPWNIRPRGLWPHKSLITRWVLNMSNKNLNINFWEMVPHWRKQHWECDLRRLYLALPLAILPLFFLLTVSPNQDALAFWFCEAKEIFLFSEPIDLVQVMKCQHTLSLCSNFHSFCLSQAAVTQELPLDLTRSSSVFLCLLLTPTCAYGSFHWFSPIKCAQGS